MPIVQEMKLLFEPKQKSKPEHETKQSLESKHDTQKESKLQEAREVIWQSKQMIDKERKSVQEMKHVLESKFKLETAIKEPEQKILPKVGDKAPTTEEGWYNLQTVPLDRELQQKLLNSQARLHEVDNFVLTSPVPADKLTSCKDLAHFLTEPFLKGSQPKHVRELRALRSIVRWVGEHIAYDVVSLYEGKVTHEICKPETVLKRGMSVCSGYSNLVEELAKHANLAVCSISGYAKGASYSPGKEVAEGDTNHAWNVATIDNVHYLIDATWAAGHTNGVSFVRKWEEHYWLTNPAEFIFDHFPEESKWQLLKDPVSFSSFLSMPYFRSSFFESKLEVVSKKELTSRANVKVGDTFQLEFKDRKGTSACMSHRLSCLEGEESDPSSSLQSNGGVHTFRFTPSKPGKWTLTFFMAPSRGIMWSGLEMCIEAV